MENTQHIFEALYDDLLIYAVSETYTSELEAAKTLYLDLDDQDDGLGFAEWFVFNNPIRTRGKRIVELFASQSQHALASDLSKSYRSFFQILQHGESFQLQDLMTLKVYQLNHEPLEKSGIMCTRIIPHGLGYDMIGDDYYLDLTYGDIIKKHLLTQYNDFVTITEPIAFEDFLRTHGQLIFQLIHTLSDIQTDNYADEDDYTLHQAVYITNVSKNDAINAIMQSGLPLIQEDDEFDVYRVSTDEGTMAEIEWVDQKILILCNQAKPLSDLMTHFKTHLSQVLHFVNQEVLTLDDLLSKD